MQKLAREILVRKRDGREIEFDNSRIAKAIANAFRAERALEAGPLTQENLKDVIAGITEEVVGAARYKAPAQPISVEEIQDVVENGLMKRGHFAVARRYILYRSEHARMRAARATQEAGGIVSSDAHAPSAVAFFVSQQGGDQIPFDLQRLRTFIKGLPESQSADVDLEELVNDVARNGFDGITTEDIARLLVLTARGRIERDPAYDCLAAALQRAILYREVLGVTQVDAVFAKAYRELFAGRIAAGVRGGRLAEVMLSFDLERLANALLPERDARFRYLGIQTIYDRYLLQVNGRRIETPQYFWMRVAMGLALAEAAESRDDRAIEFYELLSSFRFTCATPTLFNSGTPHPQLSSCYVTTVQDDLGHIFTSIRDNAMLSKWAGGLGNDWTNIRATGAVIRGTGGRSQGVVPFLKVVNDAAVAVNQGGKRKGAVCAYLEPWHLDFEEFLDLRKNTGDERRRTHDLHTAAWIPDLFMQRVRESAQWTLFSPNEVQDLHDLYGRAFQQRYEHYERMAEAGKLKLFRRVDAVDLWRKLLTRLFETGHPWVTFKDPSNIRSPQDHVGVVHSSNLCTEILLNTSQDETAVCNLGSINLAAHVIDGKLDLDSLEQTITTAMRMLDNAIDVNHYPTPESKHSNMRHRPIGLGIMGFQDTLHQLDIVYASEQAVEFADRSMEAVSYYALLASCNLARERGRYATFRESKWDRGLLPIDTINLLEEQRGEPIEVDRSTSLDWQVVREAIAKNGMRNSNCLAIAPTATISTIVGVSQSIEPTYKHLYTKSNLSGEFTQVNPELVELLKERGLWNTDLLAELKYADGSLADIAGIPDEIKRNFVTAFEIEPRWLIEAAARRQKWLDQGQSLNLYVAQPSGKLLDDIYRLAWRSGLKTTYYLRSMAATQVEKSTIDLNRHGIQPRWMKSKSASAEIGIMRSKRVGCEIDGPDCEACQ